jgi:xanthine dehydrogenase accessory factor
MDFELTNADSAGLGMICGGRGILLIENVDPTADAKAELYQALLDLLTAGGTGWLATGLSDQLGGGLKVEKCLVDSSGAITGEPVCSTEALRRLAHTGGALDGLTAVDRPGLYVQPVGAAGTAYVFGAGHCGRSLVPLLNMVGFRTVIVDDRAAFANVARFPNAEQILVPPSFEDALEGLPIGGQSYLVIMTRGHVFDRIVLDQALRTKAGYIGMIGSAKKIADVFQILRDKGFSDDDLGRVHAPIGLSIGAETPEEIAVSIAAEIIQVRRSRIA